jgi:hypothetical protein
MSQRTTFVAVFGLAALALAACSAHAVPTSAANPDDSWVYFDIAVDTAIVIDFTDDDWDQSRANANRFRGEVLQGRRSAEELIQWQLRLEPAAEFANGQRVDTVWLSARFVDDELAFLQRSGFADSLHVIAQADSGAWRALVHRSDQEG